MNVRFAHHTQSLIQSVTHSPAPHHKFTSNIWLSHQSFCYERLFSIINIRICCKFFLCQQTMVCGIFTLGSFFSLLSFFLYGTNKSEKVSKREGERMKDFKCKWHVKFEFRNFALLPCIPQWKYDWMKLTLNKIHRERKRQLGDKKMKIL